LKTLPARIDERKEQIAELTSGVITLKQAENSEKNAEDALKAANKKIDDFAKNQNSDIKTEISDLYQLRRDMRKEFEQAKNEAWQTVNKRSTRTNLLKSEKADNEKKIEKEDDYITRLREDYKKVYAEQYREKTNACLFCGENIVCPHCDEKDEDARNRFMTRRAEGLKKIQGDGGERKKKIESLKARNEEIEEELKQPQQEEPQILSLNDAPGASALEDQISELEEKVAGSAISPELLEERRKAEEELDAARRDLAAVKSNAKSENRVRELETKMSELSAEFDELEKFSFMLDEYNQKLATLTEKAVNSLFGYVRFRMFTTQVNGSAVPACDITNEQGRPFETALSTGERIRAGVDIIKTLSGHYKTKAPVFIDHAESVMSSSISMDCQTIEFHFSEKYPELTQI
jgi:hypothetical protein